MTSGNSIDGAIWGMLLDSDADLSTSISNISEYLYDYIVTLKWHSSTLKRHWSNVGKGIPSKREKLSQCWLNVKTALGHCLLVVRDVLGWYWCQVVSKWQYYDFVFWNTAFVFHGVTCERTKTTSNYMQPPTQWYTMRWHPLNSMGQKCSLTL